MASEIKESWWSETNTINSGLFILSDSNTIRLYSPEWFTHGSKCLDSLLRPSRAFSGDTEMNSQQRSTIRFLYRIGFSQWNLCEFNNFYGINSYLIHVETIKCKYNNNIILLLYLWTSVVNYRWSYHRHI